jgi:hypothetical protein
VKDVTGEFMQGSAFIFINYIQAVRCGHVGWGFSIDEMQEQFYYGSTDHLYRHPWWDLPGWIRYAHVEPELNNDWWSSIGSKSDMFEAMHRGHHIQYHACKSIPVEQARPEDAMNYAESLKSLGWSIFANNCVHQTYDVLTKYGAVLPVPDRPITNLIPKQWFSIIAGDTAVF